MMVDAGDINRPKAPGLRASADDAEAVSGMLAQARSGSTVRLDQVDVDSNWSDEGTEGETGAMESENAEACAVVEEGEEASQEVK